jgi:hypothetical protein
MLGRGRQQEEPPVGGDGEGSRLDAVYAASGAEEIARTYDDWAEGYEAEMATVGYRHPTICLGMLARHLAAGEGPVLDAGAGTGLIGEWLKILGHSAVEGVDLSPGMLRVAARKGVYDRWLEGDLTRACRSRTGASPRRSAPACSPPAMSGRKVSTSSCGWCDPAECWC